jgi:methionine sulfoxide reductase catalytic subunit
MDADGSNGSEKNIGRRAFLGLMVVGLAALFLGKDLFSWIGGSVKSASGVEGFRINSVAKAPEFEPAAWLLTVDGLFRRPLALSFAELTDLPQVERIRDFHCVEGWGVDDVKWRGVTVGELMDYADVDPQATHLVFHSADDAGYTDSLTIEEARRADTLLAHELNGEPLTHDMGSPLRLVLPDSYAYKNVKWVVRVEAVALGPEGYRGYWEERGYPADATIR